MINRLKYSLLVICCSIFSLNAFSQEDSTKFEINGYISNMQSFQFETFDGIWLNDNLIHNRLNVSWFVSENAFIKASVRNRVFTGESLKFIPGYSTMIEQSENGFLSMNWNLIDEQSIFLNTHIDRLYFQYEKGKIAASLGRQRINWGKTFVWNPNDIFNAYSFFDFDYAERPGSDAFRLQYFTSEISSLEIATKFDKNEDVTAAAIWRFNLKEYDFQLMSGILNSCDYVIGAGWSGAIKSIDFKGEMSYFRPKENFSDTSGIFQGSVSFLYTFPNTLNLMFEFLYADIQQNGMADFYNVYSGSLSAKNLSFTKYNIFGQIGYQLTPLLNGSFSVIYYPEIKGFFLGPSFDYSFTDNLYFSIISQTFSGELENPLTLEKERKTLTYGFLRLKLNF